MACYRRAGLLDDTGSGNGEAANNAGKLIGERSDLQAFRRLLYLSDALLRNTVGWLNTARPDQPRHAVVFGGTQVGKSTCVNVLLGANEARVHHLGGFTRHAQAFVPQPYRPHDVALAYPQAFKTFDQVPVDELRVDNLNLYAIQPLANRGRIPNLVVWDAPDCDAVGSARYLPALIEALSMADAVIYVTTKEKYAVDSILEWVVLLKEAGLNVIGLLNSTPRHQQRDVLNSQQAALNAVAQRHGHDELPLDAVAFPVVDAESNEEVVSILSDASFEPGNVLARKVAQAASAFRVDRAEMAMGFVQRHLPQLLEPAVAELDSLTLWQSAVEQAVLKFVHDYRYNYLDDPRRYDAFTRVSVRILDLLNPPIPGLHEALNTVRSVLRLPARAVIWVGKRALNLIFGNGETKPAAMPAEVKTYTDAHTALLNSLTSVIETERQKARHHPFWDALDQQWGRELATLQAEFQAKLDEHWRETEQRIEATAQAIYKELEKNPTQLNLLRASRLGIDAAAIVVSLVTTMHTGGLAENIIQELIVAPAMLSFIEGISQGVANNYVETRKVEFKAKMLSDTREMADQIYRPAMQRLAYHAIQDTGFVGMEPDVLKTLMARVEGMRREA